MKTYCDVAQIIKGDPFRHFNAELSELFELKDFRLIEDFPLKLNNLLDGKLPIIKRLR